MDDAHEILLSSLKSSGISLPTGVSSVKDFSPNVLISTCSQSLRLILDSAHSFPTSIPPAAAERFNICSEIASTIKSLGFREEFSFHQLLYPSDEVSYKLVKFLVEKLSDNSSEEAKNQSGNFIPESDEAIINFFREQVKTSSVSENSRSKDRCTSSQEESSLDLSGGDKCLITEPQKISFLEKEHVSKLKDEFKELQWQEKRVKDEMHAKTLDIQKMQDKHDMMRVSFELAVNNQHSVELYIQELGAKVKIRQQKVMVLETKRNVAECSLKEKRTSLAQSLFDQPDVHKKLIQLEEIERETEAILAEITKRGVEHLDLLIKLEKQPKHLSRNSYIDRVSEITKNSRKLDFGIEQILKDTRELQLESNSIQERLHRTYAVVDETVFREAKKVATGRQAYRLLTSIHDSFQHIADIILATDRAQREVAAQEVKLAALSSHRFNIAKLQADLDSITEENELLLKKSHHSSPMSALFKTSNLFKRF